MRFLHLLLLSLVLPSYIRYAEELNPTQSLVSDLLSASTDAQVNALLSASPTLVNPDLTKALLEKVPKLRSQALYEKGFQVCHLARQISERLNDQKGIIDAINMTGTLFFEKEEYDACLEKYQEGLVLSERIGYAKGEADSLNGMAWAKRRRGDLDDAIRNAQESQALYQSLGDKSGIARALHIMGAIKDDLGEWEKALELYRESLKLREELSDNLGIAHCYLSMGNTLSQREDVAQEYYKKAAAIFESEGDKKKLGAALNNIGLMLTYKGDLSLALQHHLRSLAISRQLGSKQGEAHSMNNIGVVHETQGNYDLAIDYYKKSLNLFNELGLKRFASFAMGNIAKIHALKGSYQEALEQYQKTLALCQEAKRPDTFILSEIGYVYQQMGQYEQAYEYYAKSIQDYEQRNEKESTATILPGMAKVQNSMKNYAGALQTAERAYALAKEIELPEYLWMARLEAGRAYLASGERAKAREALEDAVSQIELLRKGIAGAEMESQLYFQQHTEPYLMLVDLLLSENKTAEAFAYAERARARVLLEVLKGGKVQITKNMTDQEKEQERTLLALLQNTNEQMRDEKSTSKLDATKISKLQEELQKVRLAYESFRTNLYVDHPELKSQRGDFEIAGLEKVPEILDESEILLGYVVLQDKTHVFVLSKTAVGSSDLAVYSIPITAKDLSEEIISFRKTLADRELGFGMLATKLYGQLLKPTEAKWKGKKHMIVVPDQQLWEL